MCCCLMGGQSVGGSMDEGDVADSSGDGDIPGLPLTPVAVAAASPRSLTSAEASKVPSLAATYCATGVVGITLCPADAESGP